MAVPAPSNDRPGQAGSIGPFGPWDQRKAMIVSIAPDMARWIVEDLNTFNRPLSPSFVSELAREMTGGFWIDNGDTISFDWNGRLNDGQHRLHAAIEANFTLTVTVELGLDPKSFVTKDQGRHRDRQQVVELAYRGVREISNPAVVAAVAAMVMRYEDGGRSFYLNKKNPAASSPAIVKTIGERPSIIASGDFGQIKGGGGKKRRIEAFPRVIGFCHYMFGLTDPHARDYFFSALESGIGLETGDPILLLRKKLADLAKDDTKRNHAIQAQLQYMVKSWNFARESKSIRYLAIDYANANKTSIGPIPDIA